MCSSDVLPPKPRLMARSWVALRVVVPGVLGAHLFCCSLPAAAQTDSVPIDINKFHPAMGGQKFVTLDLAQVDPHMTFVPQLFVHYAHRPLVFRLGGTPVADLVQSRLTADVSLSVSFLKRLQVAVALPVVLWQTGELPERGFPDPDDPNSGKTVTPAFAKQGLAQAGQEDLRFSVKGVLYRKERITRWGFGLGLVADLTVPTGNTDGFMGSRLPTFTPKLVSHLDTRYVQVAAIVGGLVTSTERFYNAEARHSFLFGLGVQVALRDSNVSPVSLVTEVWGSTPFVTGDRVRNTPAELTVALKAGYRGLLFFVGGGPGLSPGAGVPDGRAYLGISYAGQVAKRPPPPPPPTPKKVLPLPSPPPPPAEVLPPSCEGEDCPETVRRPAHVEVKGQKLVLSERIFFDFDRDSIKPLSFPVLDEVVRVLKARPDIRKMRVEGHTDNRGRDIYNLDLSRRRAQAVVVYLIDHGVDPWRLTSAGFGLRCPIGPNDSPDHRAQNRRVDFIIMEQEGVALEPPKCPLSLINQ